MIDYYHPQLDPGFNRTRSEQVPRALKKENGEKESSEAKESPVFPKVNPEDPYTNTYLGMFDVSFTDSKGNFRPMRLYIPTTEKSAWNMILVFVPGGENPEVFFEKGNWKAILEKYAVTGCFLSAPKGWQKEEPGFELETAAAALKEMQSNRYFQSNAPAVYCAGFMDGAWLASLFAVTHVSVLAAWAALGDTSLDEKLLDQLGNGPSDCDPYIKRREVPLPACIFDNQSSNVVRYFREASNTAEEGLKNDYAAVYRQQPKPGESYRNDPACSEVWHGSEDTAKKLGLAKTAERMVAFMEGFKRWGGEGNGYIRKTIYPDTIGMKKTEAVVDGWKRYWLTFEPTAYKKMKKESYPLIIAIHGFTCSGEFFANNSCWHWVGEERDAFVVYPSAYPFTRSKMTPMGSHIATPEWNAGGLPDSPDPEGPDELAYFRELIRRTAAAYPIDTSRIYVTGHSNGAMMTQRLMRCMPEVFAGFAPVGFMENMNGSMEPEPADGILRNVWYTIGEYDGLGCELKEGNANVMTIEKLCSHNGVEYSSRTYYESGIYMHSLFRNKEGVPLIRFTGVKNWPHTYSPELAFLIYDEFFSRFRRLKNGELEYLA